MSDQNFAIEPLEVRLEQCLFHMVVPYVGICYKHILFCTVPYPCIKYRVICVF